MRKKQARQSNRNKSQSMDGATSSQQVQREAEERSVSCDGAVELIRVEAYRLFESRGQQPGHALDDWLQAEREILRQSPSSEDRVSL